ncbi:MAG: hypothetical protein OQL27_00365 [Sedimenticola sp.]|nr:hypothetical protein [Sedimenticola sp.]
MDSSSIELPGSEIESIKVENGSVAIRFAPAYIVKTISGSSERTRWRQQGVLVFSEAEVEGELPDLPCTCEGGDVGQSVFTYRDMIPLPFEGRGQARCELKIKGTDQLLKVMGEAVKLNMEDRPYYIEHIRTA